MVAFASAVASASAQDMMSKKGTAILPESGDWSVGFDAIPLIENFGNLFHSTGYYDFSQAPNTIVGKMMMDEETALRVRLRIGFGSTKRDNLVSDDNPAAAAGATVVDSRKISGSDITIGAGIQKYRGKGRVKGIYGAELGLMIGSGKSTYEYGNAYSAANATPTSTDWSTLTGSPALFGRPTESKDGSTFGFYLQGFIGAEYFFAPKMSLGAEYAWGLGMYSTGEGENTLEAFDGTSVTSTTSKTGKSSSFGLDVDGAASVILSMYF